MYKSFLCRYHEIATKGHNRSMFENKLLSNIQALSACEGLNELVLQRIRGRIFIRKRKNAVFEPAELETVKSVLSRAFGVESFSPVLECEPDLEKILSVVIDSAKRSIEKMLESAPSIRFRTRARRSDKSFPLKSREIEIEVASRLHELFGERIQVDLENPEFTIGIEVREQIALVFYETFKGPGGLPVGTNSDVLGLLSGGIDSPVACHMTMKRGCHLDFLTFHSFPYTPMESLEKVKRIVSVLNRYQKKGRLFACNLSEIQKLVRDHCTPKYRTVLYRRMMLRIATMLCHFHKLGAIVTGESIGQVASQTIVNLSVINDATTMLMIRPLAGMDKLESIERAQAIGTYDLSIVDVPDSCTVFAPPAPSVAAKFYLVEEEEKKIPDLNEALEAAFKNIEKFENL
ncbi:MAG: putative tRNA sulfurtransferase [Lentisphaerae bacterium ADurb.Bin242]|nr:MAG: putative tRNA sulfurtransferase [Lentisphaerae bacterium ADurb.Bin242]